MTPTTEALVLDLVASLTPGPRPYAEVIEAWRTSCPRLTVWEDAAEGGLIALGADAAGELMVSATPAGRAALAAAGRLIATAPG
jgi:hypothetical protein